MTDITVLFLAADPFKTNALALDEEVRGITANLRAAEYRNIQLISAWAVRPDDLQQLLLQHKPDVVHFSGHGTDAEQLVLSDEGGPKPVGRAALLNLFRNLKENIRVVVLNACQSGSQAKAISAVIDCSIGMERPIHDESGVVFAAAFYRALGFGQSVQVAFDLAKNAIELAGLPGFDIPVLFHRDEVDPRTVVLINAGSDSAPAEPDASSGGQHEGTGSVGRIGTRWQVVAGVLGAVAALSAILVDIDSISRRLWPGKPIVALIRYDEPGPELNYHPESRQLEFKVAFGIEHSGGRNETITAQSATFSSQSETLITFGAADLSCLSNGKPFSSIVSGTVGQIECAADHRFSEASLRSMRHPGPAVLKFEFRGRTGNQYRSTSVSQQAMNFGTSSFSAK